MKRPVIVTLALIALSLSGSALLLAQNTAGSPKPAAAGGAAADAKRRLVTTDAELVRNRPLPSGNNFTTLTRSVVIQSEDSTLHTESATYDGDTQVAATQSPIRLDDKQNTLTGDKGVAYYATRDVVITGHIVINARPNANNDPNAPKSSVRRNFKDPVTITCDRVVYNWHTKKAKLTGSLTIKQKDRTITGDKGYYDGIAETATLVGNIKSRRPTGESGDAEGAGAHAIVSFKEGEEYFEVDRDPDLKDGKVHTIEPLQEKPNGEVAPVETDDSPSPSPTPITKQASPTPSPTP